MRDAHRLSDEELMVRYQNGEEAAFQEIYRRYSGKVLGYLKGKLPPGQADDCFQASFLKLHQSRHRFDASYPFKPWLFVVVRNILFDHYRAHSMKFEEFTEEHAGSCTSEAPANAREIDLTKLSEEQRKAIELRYNEELSFSEIAARLNTSPANARQIVSGGIRKLREIFQPGGGQVKKN